MNISVLSLGVEEGILEKIISEKSKDVKVEKDNEKITLKQGDEIDIEIINDELETLFRKTKRKYFNGILKGEELKIITYAPLHITTDLCLNKSIIDTDKACNILKKQFSAGAITNDNLYGYWKFRNDMKNAGKKPICAAKLKCRITVKTGSYYLIFLAKNLTGYKNLCKLLSAENEIYSYGQIEAYKEGLICLSGGCEGELYELYKKSSSNLKLFCNIMRNIFEDDFYVEIDDSMDVNTDEMIRLFKDAGMNIIASDSACMIRYDEVSIAALKTMDVLEQMKQKGKTIIHKNRYFHNIEEMESIYSNNLRLLTETLNIVDEIEDFEIEENDPIPYDKELYETIKNLAYSSCTNEEVYLDRLDEEFELIEDMNYEFYITFLYSIVEYCKNNNILYQIRGSAYGLLIFYVLKITRDNPMEHGLLLERFLNKTRSKKIDIDIDIQQDKKNDIIQFIKNNYDLGIYKLSKITNYKAETLTAKLKNLFFGGKVPFLNNKLMDKVVEEISERPKAFGSHASGICLTKQSETYPFLKEDNLKVISVNSKSADYLNFLKIDLLSSVYLKAINDTLMENKINIDEIELKEEPFKILKSGNTTGAFELKNTDQNIVKEMFRFTSDFDEKELFERAIHLITIIRKGPKKFIPVYLANKDKYTALKKPYDVLNETYGIIIYQEQAIMLLKNVTELSIAECDEIRRIFKDGNKQEKIKAIKKVKENAKNEKIAIEVLEKISADSSYIYNKSHAVSYGHLLYVTLYLLTYHKASYLKNLLNCFYSNDDKKDFRDLMAELKDMLIDPSAESAELYFSVCGDKIMRGYNTLEDISLNEKPVFYDNIKDFVIKNNITQEMYLNFIAAGVLDVYGYSKKELLDMKNKFDYLEYRQNFLSDIDEVFAPLVDDKDNGEIVDIEQRRKTLLRLENIDDSSAEGLVQVSDIISEPDFYREGSIVCIGRVGETKVIKTQKGDDMMNFMLSHKAAKIKTTIFPSKMELAKDLKQDDNVIIRGQVNKSDYGLSIVVDDILPLQKLRGRIKRIELKRKTSDLMMRLKSFRSDDEYENEIEVVYQGNVEFRVKYCYLLEVSIKRYEPILKIV